MALEALCVTDPVRKAYALQSLWARLEARDPGLRIDTEAVIADPGDLPGRPERPALVPAVEVPQRSPFTPQGRAALLHAIAHIEFNAQNLAADVVFRFSGLPEAFYIDWMRVAAEEAKHYLLLAGHLATLGHAYGDFPAHDGLWTMTWKTREDFVARMALVPRTLEARGLDATPLIQAKLRRAGDLRAVKVAGHAGQLQFAMQRFVRNAEKRAVWHPEAEPVRGNGRAFHIQRDGARLRQALHRAGLVAQLPVAVVDGGHRAGTHHALQLITLQLGDPFHRALQRDLYLGQRRDRHPDRQIIVQHMVLTQIGMGQTEIA